MANQSWEYYQQHEPAGPAKLWWICGAASSYDPATGSVPTRFGLDNRTIYAVPFDCLAKITVTKMSVKLRSGPASAKARLGIYSQSSPNNNLPNTLEVDAGEINLSG